MSGLVVQGVHAGGIDPFGREKELPPNRISQIAAGALGVANQVGGFLVSKAVVIPVIFTVTVLVVIVVAAAILIEKVGSFIIDTIVSPITPHLRSVLDELVKILGIAARFGFGRKGEELQLASDSADGPWFVCIEPKVTREGSLPTLYAPGYLEDPETLKDTCRKLADSYGGKIYIVKYRDKLRAIEKHAEDIACVDECMFRQTGTHDRILLGHSMGGFTTGTHIRNLRDLSHIKLWVTMGTPFFGTEVAQVGFGECAQQMRPDSKFIQEFHKDEKLHKVPSLHIHSKTDHVAPFRGSPAFGKGYECVKPKGHLGLRDATDVRATIIKAMQAAERRIDSY